ncbi:MAG: thiamine-phosphate kinase, partial [Acidimicrobiales bacterium]
MTSPEGTPAGSKGGEFAYLGRLREALGGSAPPGDIYLGDDAAVVTAPEGRLLFATDIVVEGVHFDLAIGSPSDAGWKAIVGNVSDIAAMGGRPTHAVAAVAAPPGCDLDQVFSGMREATREYGVALVGGDLSSSDRLVISVAIIGGTGDVEPVTRSGARPGDELWCTGALGASAAGLAALLARPGPLAYEEAWSEAQSELAHLIRSYRRPRARPAEGALAASAGARAMIDVSAGLSQDVSHMAEVSGVGIELDEVPVASGATLTQ